RRDRVAAGRAGRVRVPRAPSAAHHPPAPAAEPPAAAAGAGARPDPGGRRPGPGDGDAHRLVLRPPSRRQAGSTELGVGRRGDRLLVYLHGLLLDAEVNRGIAEALARRGNRVVLLDLLGHGRSDKPEHASVYRIDLYAHQVFALLDHLGAEQAVLGGVSLGAN